ncbi:hypothetical protein CXQ80_13375 [Pseudomonas sp. 02C 26]|uniref:hypothetical protein n=1 Tax=Pseudomonas sp. 02C 26 TaxID=2054914 RepID=UPI000C6D3300|nr:hypothetical protein [Pseudomonas sp. 02C 26]AUF96755.1 hypothetical protein CXQ80_13375 [Pseudomonas sp. 02C 26]
MSTLLAPDPSTYRYALYCQSHLIGLSDAPAPPIALYGSREIATAHGKLLWPSTYLVIDLHGEDSPCGNRN